MENGSRVAKRVIFIYDHYDSSLIAVLVMNNIVNVAASTISMNLFLRAMTNVDDSIVSIVSSIVLTIILYIFAETLPKQIAKKIPNTAAKICVYPLLFTFFLLFPIIMIFKGISWLFNKLTKAEPEPEITQDDFNNIIEMNEKGGLLEENETDLIQASFDFTDKKVEEVLTPIDKMFTINLQGLTTSELAERVCETTYSRIPISSGNKEKIAGILMVKTFLAAYLRNPNLNVKDYLEVPYVVSPSVTMDDLLDGFRTKKTQIALVYKNKKLIGMVTAEDALEELVGNIDERISNSPKRRVSQ